MPVKRVIGIDFGTSTSVVMVKHYEDGVPSGSMDFYEYLKFNGCSTVPTLVYEAKNSNDYVCGYDAETPGFPGTLYFNFKMDLISKDIQKRDKAYDLTKKFFQYLYSVYQEQKPYFKPSVEERTFVSYPAKWPQDVRELMAAFASEAGFKNVTGLDEPTAAIHTVMMQEVDSLQEKRLAYRGDKAYFLIVDMGAGTTDLAVCRYTFGAQNSVELLSTWPTADNPALFGGREADMILHRYVGDYLKSCGITVPFNDRYLASCKAWKENNVAPLLKRGETVKSCGFIDPFFVYSFDDPAPFPILDREKFESLSADYLKQFQKMVSDCITVTKNMHQDFTDIDFVILTGGHSQWYFVPEILAGRLCYKGENQIKLHKIQADRSRILSLPAPQETVSLGLVFQLIATEMKSIASNNIWIQITVEGNRTEKKQIVKYGQVLPFTTTIETEMRLTQSSAKGNANCRCARFYGETLDTAVEYSKSFMLPYDGLAKFGGWVKSLFGKHTTDRKFKIIYNLTTDENQCTEISGTISVDTFLGSEIRFSL